MTPQIEITELIAKPLDVIAQLRADLKAETDAGDGRRDGDGSDAVAAAISEMLCAGDCLALNEVPVLSRKSLAEGKLPPDSLVRFSGMVQDQYEPEYFVGSFEEVETATGKRSRVDVKYMDSITQREGFVNQYEGAGAKTMDRLPLFCVPVPGQSKWTGSSTSEDAEEHRPDSQMDGTHAAALPKRRRDAGGDDMECTDEDDEADAIEDADRPGSGPQRKTQRASEAVTIPLDDEDAADGIGSGDPRDSAKSVPFHHGQELELAGLPCLVKLYDFREGQVKLNDTVEFVGVLGYDQSLPPLQGADEEEDGKAPETVSGSPFDGLEDFSRKVPPPSLAPRLHSIFHRVRPACAPLSVDPAQPKVALNALRGDEPLPLHAFMLDTKRHAVAHLAKALGGDMLAAEYALLVLLSRVYARTETLAPGSFSLNLRNVSAEDAQVFFAAVSDLVPKCVNVPITTSSLAEEFKFSPKKDYEADRLMLSKLQLSAGTVVILDETKLEPGQVGTEGVGNLSALKSLLSLQKVPYDFGFYKMDFEVDHPTISLSARGSVVSTDATVPVAVSAGETAAIVQEKTTTTAPEILAKIRVYIEATRRTELGLDEASSALAEEDFVKTRQQGQELTSRVDWKAMAREFSQPHLMHVGLLLHQGEDFHRMLTVARLTALSLGDPMMNASHWTHMKDLEARVAVRIEAAKNGSALVGGVATPISPSQIGPLNAIMENE